MEVFDLQALNPDEGETTLVFCERESFKVRIVTLKPGEKMPSCDMETNVMFLVVEGEVTINKNDQSVEMHKDQLFVTEPALLSMETRQGAKIMGIQV